MNHTLRFKKRFGKISTAFAASVGTKPYLIDRNETDREAVSYLWTTPHGLTAAILVTFLDEGLSFYALLDGADYGVADPPHPWDADPQVVFDALTRLRHELDSDASDHLMSRVTLARELKTTAS